MPSKPRMLAPIPTTGHRRGFRGWLFAALVATFLFSARLAGLTYAFTTLAGAPCTFSVEYLEARKFADGAGGRRAFRATDERWCGCERQCLCRRCYAPERWQHECQCDSQNHAGGRGV